MIPIHPDAYKICWLYTMHMTNGKMNEKFLTMVCQSVFEKGITTAEETQKHILEWKALKKGQALHR
jgi:hypothetical protein